MAAHRAFDDLLCRGARGELGVADFMRQFLLLVQDDLDCSSAALRLVVSTSRGIVLRTVASYERSSRRAVEINDVFGPGLGDYLDYLARAGGLLSSFVAADPRVPLMLRERLARRGVQSILDGAICVNDRLHGTVTCEQYQSTAWSPLQVQAIRDVCARAATNLVLMIGANLEAIEYAGRLAPVSLRQ
jgi:hypothetical protein